MLTRIASSVRRATSLLQLTAPTRAITNFALKSEKLTHGVGKMVVTDDPIIKLPAIPPVVELNHLQIEPTPRPMLLRQTQIEQIKHALRDAPDGKYSKKRELLALGIKSDYSVLKVNNQLYALYLGEKHDKLLGAGKCGKVKLAQNIETGEWVAVKIQVAKYKPNPKAYEFEQQCVREITEHEDAILKNMHASYGTLERHSPSKGFQTLMVMKLVQGKTIENYLNYLLLHHRTLSLHTALDLALKIGDAMHRLHTEYKVVHRDMHWGNIMFNPKNGKIKLIDFGYSINLKRSKISQARINADITFAGEVIDEIFKLVPAEHVTYSPVDMQIHKAALDFVQNTMKVAEEKELTLEVDNVKDFFSQAQTSLSPYTFRKGVFESSVMYDDEATMRAHIKTMKQYDSCTLHVPAERNLSVLECVSLARKIETHGVIVSNSAHLCSHHGLFAQSAPVKIAADVNDTELKLKR
jgi:hypothetical protein